MALEVPAGSRGERGAGSEVLLGGGKGKAGSPVRSCARE